MTSEDERMAKWVCTICGWVYDEDKGIEGRISPGTEFGELPDDFRCHTCGAMKKWFKEFEGEVVCT